MMNRREFMKASLGMMGAVVFLQGDRTSRGKRVGAWLLRSPFSDNSYQNNHSLVDAVYSFHGGSLQADGTWTEQSWKLSDEFLQDLKDPAKEYMPCISNKKGEFEQVLDSPELQEQALDNLEQHLINSFDWPWDGTITDFEGIPISYKNKLSKFHYLLYELLKSLGLKVSVSVRGRNNDGLDYENAYTYDFSMLADTSDIVDLRCYGYWLPKPRSIAPHWWIRECIEYALTCGIHRKKINLGIGLFSRHWYSLGYWDTLTYNEALGMTDFEWVENNENGIVREYYGTTPEGWMWMHDARTMTDTLKLVDE
jgi:spore germination protein YaaH